MNRNSRPRGCDAWCRKETERNVKKRGQPLRMNEVVPFRLAVGRLETGVFRLYQSRKVQNLALAGHVVPGELRSGKYTFRKLIHLGPRQSCSTARRIPRALLLTGPPSRLPVPVTWLALQPCDLCLGLFQQGTIKNESSVIGCGQ